MDRKQISQALGLCGVILVIAIAIWSLLSPGPLGKLSKGEADELFKNSKIESDKDGSKRETTGVDFFKYLKKFLESLSDHAINSTCTIEVYDGIDRTKKGELMKDIIKEAKKILFETSRAKEAIDEILKAENVNDYLIKKQLEDREKARVALAKTFIYNLLKIPHNVNDGDRNIYYANIFKNDYVKAHVSGLKGGFEGLKVKIKCNPDALVSLKVFEFLYIEMYLISRLIPVELVESIKPRTEAGIRDIGYVNEQLRKNHNAVVDALLRLQGLQEEYNKKVQAVKNEYREKDTELFTWNSGELQKLLSYGTHNEEKLRLLSYEYQEKFRILKDNYDKQLEALKKNYEARIENLRKKYNAAEDHEISERKKLLGTLSR